MSAGLYIHIPFCSRICGYCDFVTALSRDSAFAPYLTSLRSEIRLRSDDESIKELEFETLYFGGGTPSLLTARQLGSIVDSVVSSFNFGDDPEITIETNPDTVDLRKLKALRSAGANRLSLGVQSFQPDELQILDRDHTNEDSIARFDDARKAGFENISLDLIFALPDQKLRTWEKNLQKAVELDPNHISTYNLTYEEGTPFSLKLHHGIFRIASEETQRAMYLTAVEFLTSRGFGHYEVSNYARPGFESRHNRKYWQGSPYLGLGVSAHSFIHNRRFWNVANLKKYNEKLSAGILPIGGEEVLSSESRSLERVLLGLRQRRGIDIRAFEAAIGISFFEKYPRQLKKFFDFDFTDQDDLVADLTCGVHNLDGTFLEINEGFLRLTDRGLVLSDAICAEFL